MIRLNIQITPEQDEALRKASFETRESVAEHVRKAIDSYLYAIYGGNYQKASPDKE
jgi:hypothetical protein